MIFVITVLPFFGEKLLLEVLGEPDLVLQWIALKCGNDHLGLF